MPPSIQIYTFEQTAKGASEGAGERPGTRAPARPNFAPEEFNRAELPRACSGSLSAANQLVTPVTVAAPRAAKELQIMMDCYGTMAAGRKVITSFACRAKVADKPLSGAVQVDPK